MNQVENEKNIIVERIKNNEKLKLYFLFSFFDFVKFSYLKYF